MSETKNDPAPVLAASGVPGKPLYIVGTFDTGVTVLSQQVRSLNLVWALIESGRIPTVHSGSVLATRMKLAIVGGGFSGLSVAAGLLKKQANATITIFEERDALLPLQQGCDSRWLHPQIYDWPGEGSEAFAAMLPVLNWTAARASDVVVQVLTEWKRVLAQHNHLPPKPPTLYCNTRHLQISNSHDDPTKLRIEWVGELRNAEDATSKTQQAVGSSDDFDVVIMAVGFGLEASDTSSYWRNEMIGQPSLEQPRRMYLVSGQGDGAMIDLLRVRVSQYRQDRILEELFDDKHALLAAIKEIYEGYKRNRDGRDLFDAFERLTNDPRWADEFADVRQRLVHRLRRDTEAILHVKVRRFAELFDPANAKTSFQNKLLIYFLYRSGGFVPSCLAEKSLVQQHAIPPIQIIHRHGTYRDQLLKQILSDELYELLHRRRVGVTPDPFLQSDKLLWSGGYFDFPGRLDDAPSLPDELKQRWRKEYLPSPTALLATAFCAAMAAALLSSHSTPGRLRVTLHRTLSLGGQPLLQQTCDYEGIADEAGAESTAARTFPASNATIGMAYRSRRIVRSLPNVPSELLHRAMEALNLHAASRDMSREVTFVLAVPILQPEITGQFIRPTPVSGVIYIDSKAPGFFIGDDELKRLVSMTQQFMDGIERLLRSKSQRIRNVPMTGLGTVVPTPDQLPEDVRNALELVEGVELPKTASPFQFNLDYSDFVSYRGD